MPTKPKPQRGWKPAGTFPPFPFLDQDYQQLAQIIGINAFDEDTQSALTKAAHDYFSEHGLLDNRPRNSNTVATLKILIKKTKDLADCLKDLDLITEETLAAASVDRNLIDTDQLPDIPEDMDLSDPELKPLIEKITHRPESISPTLERCLSDTRSINRTAHKALITLSNSEHKDPGGPTKKRIALRSYIINLKNIYEKATGRKAPGPATIHSKYQDWCEKDLYMGPFFNFVYNCLKINDISFKNSALASQIKKVFLDT